MHLIFPANSCFDSFECKEVVTKNETIIKMYVVTRCGA